MAISWAYPFLTPQDYFILSQFSKPRGRGVVDQFIEQRGQGNVSRVNRVEISQALALRIREFIAKDGLNTRGEVPDSDAFRSRSASRTIYTVKFALHGIAGKRGGWFILERGGREPIIKDEFISYGPMRKSGTRKNRYRRNLSYSEKNQVEYMNAKTPTIDQMVDWILKKYPSDVLNLDFDSIRS
jgi:hypothetical protein